MSLIYIDQDKLCVSRTNMRYGRKAPDVSDILPTVRKRGVIQTLLVRPGALEGHYEIVAGARRYHAAQIVAQETGEAEPLPCRILAQSDDAAAIEASMIENVARLDADEVTQWESFTRLVKEGRGADEIAATFGLPDLAIRRILALGNLLPRIRTLYRAEKIDRATVRHLTLASKSQQKAWLSLYDDPDSYVPTGHQLKAWLFGGQSIAARFALFSLDAYPGVMIADLFGEDRYFGDADAFWAAQYAAIEAAREAYLAQGWSDMIVVPPSEHFHVWEYEKAAKRKGGRVYADVRSSGEVIFHEGYVTRSEARKAMRCAPSGEAKAQRPELTSTLQTYVDLHRHAAVRAALLAHPPVALRLMVAHAIVGSPLWSLRPEPQATHNDAVRESVETAKGEAVFDAQRREVLNRLGFSDEEPTVTGGNGDDHGVAGVFLRLIAMPDMAVMEIIAIIIGETLAAGSAAVEAVGTVIDIDMAQWWEADEAFLSLLRDRELLGHLVEEVAGATVAAANRAEKARTLRQIIADHLAGAEGRTKTEHWVPRWMAFPPSAYTERGGVGTVAAHGRALAAGDALGAVQPEEEEALPRAA